MVLSLVGQDISLPSVLILVPRFMGGPNGHFLFTIPQIHTSEPPGMSDEEEAFSIGCPGRDEQHCIHLN